MVRFPLQNRLVQTEFDCQSLAGKFLEPTAGAFLEGVVVLLEIDVFGRSGGDAGRMRLCKLDEAQTQDALTVAKNHRFGFGKMGHGCG